MAHVPDDPIFQGNALPKEEVAALSTAARRGSKAATQIFLDRVEELQMKGLTCDPIQVLMEIASGRVLKSNGTVEPMVPPPDAAVRGKAAAELCSYIFPKRKAVELSSDPEQPVKFMVVPDHEPLPGAVGVTVIDGDTTSLLSEKVGEAIDHATDDEPAD